MSPFRFSVMALVGVASLIGDREVRAQAPSAPPASAPPAQAPVATAPPAPETTATMRTMTIAEALEYARAHQPAIRAALARVEARMAGARESTAQWQPVVGATAQIYAMTANNTTGTFANVDGMDIPRIGGTPADTTYSWQPRASTIAAAGIRQEVFDFGRIGAERAVGDALVTVSQRQAEAARLDVDFAVEEAFFAVLAAKGVVRAASDAYARSLVHRDMAKRGVESGLRSPIELTRAEADLARYDVGRVRATGGLAVAQAVLAAAIGAPDAAIDAADTAPSPSDMPALPDAIARAQGRDPRLAAAIGELRATEERTRAIGAQLRPDLAATATISGRAGGAPPSSGTVPTGDGWLPSVPNWDIGVVFTWPLFDGVVHARQETSTTNERVQRDEIDAARVRIIARVRETYEEVQVARSAVIALQNAVVAARANWEQADARFRAGMGNAVEVADAEAVRADADVQLALGQFDLARSRAAFGRAIAEGL